MTDTRGAHSADMTRAQRVQWWLVAGSGAACVALLAATWFSPAAVPDGFSGRAHAVDLLLFALLTLVVWHRIVMDALVWVLSRRVRPDVRAPEPQAGLRVAFITTFVPGAEPLEMLERTLVSLRDADYPHDTWVLDEGDDAATRELCARLGVQHFSRRGVARWNTEDGAFAAKTKGGNHNAWYDDHADDYDVVAQIDTDFTASPDFLTATLGYFRDPRVGWVGTPQVYGNTGSFVARGAAQQTWSFYGPVLRGLADRGLGLMLGANHVVRVSALRSVGFYEGHLTEDLATGMKLHAAGWRSRYVPRVLAVGEGPTTWPAYLNQQMRWSFGCLHVLRHQTPTAMRTLPWLGRFYYLWLQLNYLNGLGLLVSTGLLISYLVSGATPLGLTFGAVVVGYLPLLVWRQVGLLWLQRLNVDPARERGLMLASRVLHLGAMPVYAAACVGVVLGRRIRFMVTPKGEGLVVRTPLSVFRLHTGLALVLLAAGGYGLLAGHTAWALLAWTVVTCTSMLGFAVWELGRRTSVAVPLATSAAVSQVRVVAAVARLEAGAVAASGARAVRDAGASVLVLPSAAPSPRVIDLTDGALARRRSGLGPVALPSLG